MVIQLTSVFVTRIKENGPPDKSHLKGFTSTGYISKWHLSHLHTSLLSKLVNFKQKLSWIDCHILCNFIAWNGLRLSIQRCICWSATGWSLHWLYFLHFLTVVEFCEELFPFSLMNSSLETLGLLQPFLQNPRFWYNDCACNPAFIHHLWNFTVCISDCWLLWMGDF